MQAPTRPAADPKDPNAPVSRRHDAVTVLLIIAVCFLQAAAINGFYVPHGFLSGGVTGIAMLGLYLFDWPIWVTVITLNIPICLVGFKLLKARTVLFSVLAFSVFALASALTRGLDFGVEDPVIAALAGGALVGLSSAPVVKRDATMGGTDIITAILSRRYSISMGTFSIMLNILIMGTLAVFRGLELGLISILATCAANMSFTAALRAMNRRVTVFIITDRWDEIAQPVLEVMHRGVTYIQAEGGYTHAPKKLVYCMVKNSELARLKNIVREHDPNALLSIIESREVIGRGFGGMN